MTGYQMGCSRYVQVLFSILQPQEQSLPGGSHKIVVFIPADHVDKLREELTNIGVGVIGNYNQCSFTIEGTGTFLGNNEAKPVVGRKGNLEKVNEVRVEMVCAKSKLSQVAKVIHVVHPYETPAWDIYALHPQVSSVHGQGRLVKFEKEVPLDCIIGCIKDLFGLKLVRIAIPDRKSRESVMIQSVALCAGAGATVIGGIDADLYLTGEMRHHEILEATANGTTVILCEHTNTERGYLKVFSKKLDSVLAGKVVIHISEVDSDPLVIV